MWHTIVEVAVLLGYGGTKVRILIAQGRLTSVKDGQARPRPAALGRRVHRAPHRDPQPTPQPHAEERSPWPAAHQRDPGGADGPEGLEEGRTDGLSQAAAHHRTRLRSDQRRPRRQTVHAPREAAAASEWKLLMGTHNLLKLYRQSLTDPTSTGWASRAGAPATC